MADEDPLERTASKPMYGERRPHLPALLGVLGMVVVIVAVFLVLTYIS